MFWKFNVVKKTEMEFGNVRREKKTNYCDKTFEQTKENEINWTNCKQAIWGKRERFFLFFFALQLNKFFFSTRYFFFYFFLSLDVTPNVHSNDIMAAEAVYRNYTANRIFCLSLWTSTIFFWWVWLTIMSVCYGMFSFRMKN